jgi:ABC-type transporter lipoprotein component MlaA
MFYLWIQHDADGHPHSLRIRFETEVEREDWLKLFFRAVNSFNASIDSPIAAPVWVEAQSFTTRMMIIDAETVDAYEVANRIKDMYHLSQAA